jgi:DNA invertase Pin-like site-specific DNA recombinase
LARSTLQVLEILELAAKKRISVHIVKNGLVMDGSIQATITATILGLAAQIEREFISMRTKEALERRRKEGKHLGRKKGDTPKMKILYANKRKLVREHQRGESCAELARQMGVSRTTMFRFLRHY